MQNLKGMDSGLKCVESQLKSSHEELWNADTLCNEGHQYITESYKLIYTVKPC
jgi:hypothetical protein